MSKCKTVIKSDSDNNVIKNICHANNGTIPEDYILSYQFNGDLNDDTGNYDAINNGCTFGENRKGKADSSLLSDGICTVSSNITEQVSNWTISFWIKPNSISGAPVYILGEGISNALLINFVFSDLSILYVYRTPTSNNSSRIFYNYTDSSWVNVCVKLSDIPSQPQKDLSLYINGEFYSRIYTDEITSFLFPSALLLSSQYNGSIDDFRIYSYPLSDGIIRTLYLENENVTQFSKNSQCRTVVEKECFKGNFESWILADGTWNDEGTWTELGVWKTA